MKKDTTNITSRILLDVAAEHGVTDIICSPGSRNSPLLIAAYCRDSLHKHVITDERVAAFFALGMAMVSQRPVMLVCTSGSAILNYAPAVAEAFYHGVPLIVVSADRPKEWIDQDDSQTIRQDGILSNIVKKSYDIQVAPESESSSFKEYSWFCNRIVNEAMLASMRPKRGPVHLNIRLSPPLTGIETLPENIREERIVREYRPESKLPADIMNELAKRAAGKKIMLVAGFGAPNQRLNRAVNEFGKLDNVTVMAETISNIHSDGDYASVDLSLSLADSELLPDIIISVGGALVSRNLKEYLRKNTNAEHWCLGSSDTVVDCFMSLTTKIEIDASSFLLRLASLLRRNPVVSRSNYNMKWTEIRKRTREYHNRYLATLPWCDMKAFEIILSSIPSSWNLFLSNGTPVRYGQLFDYPFHATFCNRGVSGIDGCTSTAIGGACATHVPTALITGDLSFTYDLGALGIPLSGDTGIVIFVISNGGGGIFRFIKSTATLEEELLDKYFCVRPEVDIASIAKGFGFDYIAIDNNNYLSAGESIKQLCGMKHRNSTIVEVKTDGSLSAKILRNYFENIHNK